MQDNKRGFLKRTAIALGLTEDPTEVRSEIPVLGSPYLPVNAVNLTGINDTAISPDRAIGVASVYRAVTIISTAVSQLPLGVWRGGEEIDTTTSSVINRPNLDTSRAAFLEQTTVSMATAGEAFWLLSRSGPTAAVTNIEVLNPYLIFIEVKNGKNVYRYGDKTYADWQIKHLWLTRLPGYSRGIGPIQASQNEIRGAIDLRNYADNWFREAGVPNGVLSTDKNISPDDADLIKARFLETQANRSVAVLGQGVGYQPIYLSPADAQFIESQSFSITQIARMFGVPATYMLAGVDGNSMTYTNLEMVDTQFVKYTLMKYLSEIESALSDLLPRGQEVKFKVETLLRADFKTRMEAYNVAIQAGVLTVNEVRAAEGRLPLPNASSKPVAPVQDGNTQGTGNES